MSSSSSRLRSDSFAGSHRYWTAVAHSQPAAQALAERLGLSLIQPDAGTVGMKSGLIYPIRRLVVTGEDTPENMEILLGPEWEGCRRVWDECRMTVLATQGPDALPDSPTTAAKASTAVILDEGTTKFAPRPPSTKEEAKLERVRRNLREKARKD